MFSVWKNVLLKPKESLTAEAAKADVALMDGLVPYVLAAVVSAIMFFLGQLLGLSFGASAMGAAFDVVGALIGAVFVLVAVVVFSLLEAALLWIIAMALGGKASYAKLYYLLSTFCVPISIITAVVGMIPCLGGLISLILGIYTLVLLVIAMKRLYGFDTAKAAITVIVFFVVLLAIILVLAVVIFGVAVLGALGSMAAAGTGGL